jgi:phage tail sheath gpL-like
MAAPYIPITGIGGDWRKPGNYAEILFAQGPASAASGEREVVFVMPMLSTGTWTANTLYPCNDTATAEIGAGSGSMPHRAMRIAARANKDAKFWVMPYAETSGGSPVAATGVITFTFTTGSNPTATGVASVTICGEDNSYTYKTTDTLTTIAAGLKGVINAKPWLPVSADNSSGVLTLTAKLKGVSQGTASLGVIRFRAAVTAGTNAVVATSGAALGLGTGVAGAEGSTTEAANLTTALAALDAVRKYYVVVSVNDATSLTALKTHIVNKSEPRRGLRSLGVYGFTGSAAQAATINIARNYERLECYRQENSEHDSVELAAYFAAVLQKEEGRDATVNLSGYRSSDFILPVYDAADRPTDVEMNDDINDGCSTIATDEQGTYLVMHCNTRSKNAAGTQDDFRATEGHRRSGADAFVDDLLLNYALNFSGKKFKPDELLADGKFNPNQPQIQNVVRPSTIVPFIKRKLDDFDSLGHLQDLQASKESVRVLKNSSRAEVALDLHIIDHLDVSTFRIAEVSTG